MSCPGIIVPDPLGVLEADEIHIRSPQSDLLLPNGLTTNQLELPVLGLRHPVTLPTGIRKLRAVSKPELRDYEGVIICSTRGAQRQVEIMDGDYDGDTMEIYWDPELVASFKNSPIHPRPDINHHFSSNTEKVTDFLLRTAGLDIDAKVIAMHEVLLDALQDNSPVGIYAGIHDYAIYTLGYSDPRTMHLGLMKNDVLDRRKHGGKVIREVFVKDRELTNGYGAPPWRNKPLVGNAIYPKRPKRLGPFIMDKLCRRTKQEKDSKLMEMEKFFGSLPKVPENMDLTAPWLKAWHQAEAEAQRGANSLALIESLRTQVSGAAESMRSELQHSLLNTISLLEEESPDAGAGRRLADLTAIKQHVEALYAQFREKAREDARRLDMNKSKPVEARQDALRLLSRKFASMALPPDSPYSEAEIARLRASYSYIYDRKQMKDSPFPWAMAMRDLTEIQCHALGGSKTVTREFSEHMFVKLW